MNVRGATPPLAGQPPRNGSRDSVLCHPSKLSPHVPPATRSASSAAFLIPRSNSCAAALSKSPVVKDAPITPQEAKSNYGALLTPHEHKEILAYPEIYFVGFFSKKIQATGSTTNFDTPDHHYRVAVGDHIAYRYEIRSILGTGAFGQVLRCFDHKSRENVAVKVIVNTKETEKQPTKAEKPEHKEIASVVTTEPQNQKPEKVVDPYQFLKGLFEVAGKTVEIESLEDEKYIHLTVTGDDLGDMIGHRGDCFYAISRLLSAVSGKQDKKILLDIGGFKERRAESLTELAKRTANKVAKSGRYIKL